MSNIRPISDPAIATAMLATMQSIDSVRSAPSGISEPRWRILQCIAKAAPNVPSPGELRLCSGLNKAALAEHVQALRWKGLLEMDGYRLSPSAAAMVGLEQAYPPKDAEAMTFAALPTEAELPLADIGPLPAAPVVVKPTMDPADVPACLRPDCMPPEPQIPAPKAGEGKKTNDHGRGSAAAARPTQGDVQRDRVATGRALRATEEVAGSNPAPGQPAKLQHRAPPAEPPKFVNWIEERQRRLDSAILFLKSKAILVTVVDRDAQVRQYFVSGKRDRKFAEEVIEIAIEKGWAE